MNADGTPNSNGGLVSVPQAATKLGVSVRTVYREIADGKLHLIHIRGCSRVEETEVQALIEAQKEKRPA